MDFSPERIEQSLRAWPAPKRYVVLASGGCDSTVLLHAMSEIAGQLSAPVVALHFDHGINASCADWALAVAGEAASLGLDCSIECLELHGGGAVETRAREARYARLCEWMTPGDCCLTAHHGDDQAETFLLQALRGAGPAGLAAMPALTRFGPGWLGRPLLEFTRAELRAWAEARALAWIEDPANDDLSVPRNRLRHKVWPRIVEAWPAAARTLVRSAALAAQAAALIEEIGAEDLERLDATDADRLPIDALLALSLPRRRALLRHWLRRREIALPEEAKLVELEREFIACDPGSRAVLNLRNAEVRRFRGNLHVLRPLPAPPARPIPLTRGGYVDLGPLGRIGLVADLEGSFCSVAEGCELELCFRGGGEAFRPAGSAHHRTLKKLLQEREILPWMRFRLPLLYVNGVLAAVAGIAVAEEFAGKGWSFDWQDAPPLQ